MTATLLCIHAHYTRGKVGAATRAMCVVLAQVAPQKAAGLLLAERSALAVLLQLVIDAGDAWAGFAARVQRLLSPQADADNTASSPLPEPLSEREAEVLRLMSEGRTNKAIAEALVVAPSTVKTQINYIPAKLGAANRTETVTRAFGLLK